MPTWIQFRWFSYRAGFSDLIGNDAFQEASDIADGQTKNANVLGEGCRRFGTNDQGSFYLPPGTARETLGCWSNIQGT